MLLTRFSSPDGVGEIVDFMPFPEPGERPRLVRRVRAVRGMVRFRMVCAPRLDYARAEMAAAAAGDTVVLFQAAAAGLCLWSSEALRVEGSAATAAFTLEHDQVADFVLLDADGARPEPGDVDRAFDACVARWHGWAGRSTYRGRWREAVNRVGAGAQTTDLPRSWVDCGSGDVRVAGGAWGRTELGLSRDVDPGCVVHRLCVHAAGLHGGGGSFMLWVNARVDACPSGKHLRIMYALDGVPPMAEAVLPHLRGYGGAAPVRIGNAAYGQTQLDIYGELLDAVYLATKYGDAISYQGWRKVVGIVDWVCGHWRDPDHGIWEMRGPKREFLHSRLMCWVAGPGVAAGAEALVTSAVGAVACRADEIHASIWEEFWDEERQRFVLWKGGTGLDGYASPVGLFSEEIGPLGEQLGNTPQALTHLALISAAYYLDRELAGIG